MARMSSPSVALKRGAGVAANRGRGHTESNPVVPSQRVRVLRGDHLRSKVAFESFLDWMWKKAGPNKVEDPAFPTFGTTGRGRMSPP